MSLSAESLKQENLEYWSKRAASYSEQNQNELASFQHQAWEHELLSPVDQLFPDVDHSSLRVLDIGCGPGIFSILMTSNGLNVTAIDYTPNMLEQARKNAGELADRIAFIQMDAQALQFEDETFDIIVSRNVTWNLPRPVDAYQEWARVLKPGGLLINFDANWYNYLYEDDDQKAAEIRQRVGGRGMDGRRIKTDTATMERIATQIPLSELSRPAWDFAVLGPLFSQVEAEEDMGSRVFTADELADYAATPLFKIIAQK